MDVVGRSCDGDTEIKRTLRGDAQESLWRWGEPNRKSLFMC
jgi:hypothetical protein